MKKRINGYQRAPQVGGTIDTYDEDARCDGVFMKLVRLHEVPEDVCPRREAVSGAIIAWLLAFGLIWCLVAWLIWGWG